MRYFKLGQDQRIPYSVQLTGLNKADGYDDLSSLDRAILSHVDTSTASFYPDILDRQIFMIKDRVKEVFDLFLPAIEYKHCCLLDSQSDRYDIYYIPMLDVMDIQEGAAQGRYIFRIAHTKIFQVAASLDVVEALLRRNSSGIKISPIS